MIKRTLYFGNPAYLKTKNEQLVVELVQTGEVKVTAIEDIGVLILDNQQITTDVRVVAYFDRCQRPKLIQKLKANHNEYDHQRN